MGNQLETGNQFVISNNLKSSEKKLLGHGVKIDFVMIVSRNEQVIYRAEGSQSLCQVFSAPESFLIRREYLGYQQLVSKNVQVWVCVACGK